MKKTGKLFRLNEDGTETFLGEVYGMTPLTAEPTESVLPPRSKIDAITITITIPSLVREMK